MMAKTGFSDERGTIFGEEENMTSYPNPFTDDFALRMEGEDDDVAQVSVFTKTGMPVENVKDLSVNTNHQLGRSWSPGIYIVKINRSGKLTTHMVIKK